MKLKYFPFKPRPYQEEVIDKIAGNIDVKNICLHAPTGFGKTAVILSSLIPRMLRGFKVIWAVRTGNETDRPVEEFRRIVEKYGLKLFGISYRGKRDMCLLAEKYGEEYDYSDVSYMCSILKENCKYYLKFKEMFNPSEYLSLGSLKYSEIYSLGKNLNMCPYYIQRSLAQYSTLISLSYNYIVDAKLEWSIRPLIRFRRAILVVDEAHNLQNLELNSDTVTLGTVRRARREAEEYKAEEIVSMLNYVEERMLEIYSRIGEGEDASFNPENLIRDSDRQFLLEAERLGELVRRRKFERGIRPRSSLHHFAKFMLKALSNIEVEGVAFIAEREENNLRLNLWDMRASEILGGRWPLFRKCIFCSGALEPIDAFAETVGLKNYMEIKVPNIYGRENIKVYIATGLSTRGEDLSDEMAGRYVETAKRFLARVKVNSAIFTASYRVQEKLLQYGLKSEAEGLGYKVFLEERGMSGPESNRILEMFKRRGVNEPSLLVAPIGGRFAEGADFPGEELQAILLAGIPFQRPTTRVKLYIEYYEKLYGEEKGKLYAYIIPAFKRAAQALGRAVRSLEDKAVLILADNRYIGYLHLLPEYVREWYRRIYYRRIGEIEVPWEES
ncbi:MAG: ATP-dependent DNA helicase [archaeon GB-1845-036]|nr:ATP-dependent DNA helicase [Candidatus Culexmicrobium thermophilum]HDO20956.1 ATP-dependent DNA helicase [Candidatus Bathyarchaeota archaeon]